MKKIFVFLFALLVSLSLFGCQKTTKELSKDNIKIGLICLHDESSTYDANFITSMKTALDNLGISEDQLELVTGVPEGQECYDKACELAVTCDFVFADSFGHEGYIILAAKSNPNTYFAHATGVKAHTEKLDNYSNAFAAIYEGRYIAGIAAGMKLNEMITAKKITADQAKIGYVGAFPYAEVKSGYTAFYLGAKSVCPSVTMDVRFTSSWYDFDKEKSTTEALIQGRCVLISQHADSYGAPDACENAKVPNVSYNGSTATQCPETFIVSSRIDWAPYFEYAITQVLNKQKIDYDWIGTLATGSVKMTECGKNAAAGTQEAIDAAIESFKKGEIKVFDIDNFTVKGNKITTYLADVDDDGTYVGETEVIIDGYFQESKFRSAPYFDLSIDGINLLND